jgi:hypothetical protein
MTLPTPLLLIKVLSLVGMILWDFALYLFQGGGVLTFVQGLLGTLVILVPAYLLHKREVKKEKVQADEARTTSGQFITDSLLQYGRDREKRIDERESHLREEERAFFQNQLDTSRDRSHVLGNGYMTMVLANDRLINLLMSHDIEVPPELYAYRTRAEVNAELRQIEQERKPVLTEVGKEVLDKS